MPNVALEKNVVYFRDVTTDNNVSHQVQQQVRKILNKQALFYTVQLEILSKSSQMNRGLFCFLFIACTNAPQYGLTRQCPATTITCINNAQCGSGQECCLLQRCNNRQQCITSSTSTTGQEIIFKINKIQKIKIMRLNTYKENPGFLVSLPEHKITKCFDIFVCSMW